MLADLLAKIMDATIAAGVSYLVGTIRAETGVGAVIGYLAGTGCHAYLA